jgi:hypothetical protein
MVGINKPYDANIISLYHPATRNDSEVVDILPRKLLSEMNLQDDEYLEGFSDSKERFLKDVSLHDVRLDPDSVYGCA